MLTVGDDIAGSVLELNDWEVPVKRAAQEIAAFASDSQKYLNALTLVETAASCFRIDAVHLGCRAFRERTQQTEARRKGNGR